MLQLEGSMKTYVTKLQFAVVPHVLAKNIFVFIRATVRNITNFSVLVAYVLAFSAIQFLSFGAVSWLCLCLPLICSKPFPSKREVFFPAASIICCLGHSIILNDMLTSNMVPSVAKTARDGKQKVCYTYPTELSQVVTHCSM